MLEPDNSPGIKLGGAFNMWRFAWNEWEIGTDLDFSRINTE